MKTNRKITRSEKKLFFIAGFSIAFIIAFGAWRQYVDAIPEAVIPTPKMPSPNAFNLYVAAGKSLTQQQLVYDAIDGVMPVRNQAGNISDKKRPCTSADRISLLTANSRALTLLRQGLKISYQEPIYQFRQNAPPYSMHFRQLANLLALQGLEHEHQSDWKKAGEDYLAIIKFGAANSDHPAGLVGYTRGQSLESQGKLGLWRVLKHLNGIQQQTVLTQLQLRENARPALARTLQDESWFMQSSLIDIFQNLNWKNQLSYQPSRLESQNWEKWARLQISGKRGFLDDYVQTLNAAIANSRLPYTKRDTSFASQSLSDDFQPNWSRVYFIDARARASHNLLTIAYALELYKDQHKQYPKSLNQLIPRFLKKIPADAFGAGEALHYKLSGREYSVYSIGPDGIDNHGLAINTQGVLKEPKGLFVQPESKGDYVAGINH